MRQRSRAGAGAAPCPGSERPSSVDAVPLVDAAGSVDEPRGIASTCPRPSTLDPGTPARAMARRRPTRAAAGRQRRTPRPRTTVARCGRSPDRRRSTQPLQRGPPTDPRAPAGSGAATRLDERRDLRRSAGRSGDRRRVAAGRTAACHPGSRRDAARAGSSGGRGCCGHGHVDGDRPREVDVSGQPVPRGRTPRGRRRRLARSAHHDLRRRRRQRRSARAATSRRRPRAASAGTDARPRPAAGERLACEPRRRARAARWRARRADVGRGGGVDRGGAGRRRARQATAPS